MDFKHKTLIEPFKIKVVEPLVRNTPAQRKIILKNAGYNLFNIASEDISFDFLTDSGTTAMSAAQWSAMMRADESYAGSRSFLRFEQAVREITGYPHVLPSHQGRAAENVFTAALVKTGSLIPSNSHFDTTRALIESRGGKTTDLVSHDSDPKFKGNMDCEMLEIFCSENKGKIAFGMSTITNNSVGGQPVSYANLKKTAEIYRKHGILFILDACRFAENAYFIKTREKGFENESVRSIVRKVFDLADGCLVSAKKDGMVNMGGFIALKSDEYLPQVRSQLIMMEGFPTYGGMAARDLEALAVGLEEVLDEGYLEHRIGQTAYMAEQMNGVGVPTVQPAGGHAVFIDVGKFLPNLPKEQYPGHALACALYLVDGVRTSVVGSAMFAGAHMNKGAIEMVRLALPRRAYTRSHIDYVVEGMAYLAKNKDLVRGLRLVSAPAIMANFSARFEPV